MKDATESRYADMADRMGDSHLRDVQVRNAERARHASRFQVSDGLQPMSQGWAKYHPGEPTVQVVDAWGKPRWITPKQYAILQAVRNLREQASMTRIAASLGYATSTVSRALLRLSSLGLVAYDVTRGRYGGIRIVKAIGRSLEDRAQAAWEKLKGMRITRERAWYARLEASGYPVPSMLRPVRIMDATLNVLRPWTPAELADAGL